MSQNPLYNAPLFFLFPVSLHQASGLQRRLVELEAAERQVREVLTEREAGLQQSLLLHCEETSKLVLALEEQSTQVKTRVTKTVS